MSLTVYMNHGQIDMRHALLSHAHEALNQDNNLTVYYIVPNHVKFDSEVDVLRRFARLTGQNPDTSLYAQSRLQVYSLSRLTWALLKDMATMQPNVIQGTGLFIMVSDILRDYAGQLPIFARMQSKAGFVTTLVAQLVELRASRISPEDLLTILNQESDDDTFLRQTLSGKLRDLAIVADALEKKMGHTYITQQEVLSFFATQLATTQLKNVAFYFDGFNGFTSPETQVMIELMARYPVTVALLGDVEKLGSQQPGDLFYKPMTTAQRLAQFTKIANQQVVWQVPTQARCLDDSIISVMSAWEKLGEYRQFNSENKKTDLAAFVAENTMVEIQEVARRIRQLLVAHPDLRLRDILILARDLTPYTGHIPEVMQQFDLPYFLDTDQKMTNHPLVELLLNLLRPAKERFQYQQVMAILKTGLLRPYTEGSLVPEGDFFDIVSYLDNYLYANQPFERTWRELDHPFTLFTVSEDEDDEDSRVVLDDKTVNRRIETLRRFVIDAFDSLQQQLNQAQTMRQAATLIILWLEKYHVTEAILSQRDTLLAAGELSRSREGEEVWEMMTQTLDEIVAIDGDERFELEKFKAILVAGFEGATFSGIPNNLDQLTISEAGIVQSNDYQYLFFIGGTRNNLPAQLKSRALINDAERLIVQPALQENSTPKYLQNTAQQQMAEENLLFYGALTAATKNIVLSYPALDAGGQISDMSPFFKRLVDAFNITVNKVTATPATSQALLKYYVGSVRSTLGELVKIAASQQQTSAYQALRNTINQSEPERLERVLSAPNYKNQTETLKPEFVQALFGETLNMSISQLESYYNNPLAYFLQYGLALKERLTNRLNVAQTGTLYHAVFEGVVQQLIIQQLSLRDISQKALQQLVADNMAEITAQPAYQMLQETGKMRATQHYLAKVSEILAVNMQRAARVNHAQPKAVERLFGFPNRQSLPALVVSTPQATVHLRGKIDRLDSQDPSQVYGTIIDYKSNGKHFDWGQAYDGRQMQLLTYWQAAQLSAEQLGIEAIGGAFFAKIAPEKLTIKDFKGDVRAMLRGEIKPEQFKYRGLFISEPAYIDSLETLAEGEGSQFYQLKKKANGELYANSDVISPEDFELLLKRNLDNIQRASAAILSGDFPLSPAEGSLQFTPFTDVLRFDRALGDQYKNNTPKNKSDILKLLKADEE
ncbi:PD-(D/E)XK nuclease family protein [Leuconostoc citreum]|uniref:PD-(D/E)XK nuclease family protein n=1 Tax=Leuconostoc citreum TaxID=33964 RepID=UPI000543B0C3|nr:PD-(D/E)XK nuclease family protein [Leuconostoc citreum]MDY5162294.1 PD-(D/E)XK nuclease family protein [Leuconostoc citreum]MDY5165895.1 PD-(D/E)XK nuclease family protein [Leuconostoc citreum]CDX66753.1 ATP-dependent helicase/deoxyribonuclease subunit B [Leuconostoc citreum]